MLTPLHSIIDKREHEKYLSLPLYRNTENQLVIVNAPITLKAKGWLHFVFQHFTDCFKPKDGKLNTFAINTITKFPRSPEAAPYRKSSVEKGIKNKGEQW